MDIHLHLQALAFSNVQNLQMAKLDDRKEKEIEKQINLDMSLHFNITEFLMSKCSFKWFYCIKKWLFAQPYCLISLEMIKKLMNNYKAFEQCHAFLLCALKVSPISVKPMVNWFNWALRFNFLGINFFRSYLIWPKDFSIKNINFFKLHNKELSQVQ